MIVDNAIYVDGRRAAEPSSLQKTYESCQQRRRVAWIDLYKPTEEEFTSVAEELGLAAHLGGRGRDQGPPEAQG
jgi:magnesium transporter